MKKLTFVIGLTLFLLIGLGVNADSVGQKYDFYIDPFYDSSGREELSAILVKTTPKIYFYIDQDWWNFSPQSEIYQALSELGEDFEANIYPKLTSSFGPEWNPGIDKESRITVLIHPMKETAGGYFRSNDEYSKLEVPDSNEREMLYLNAKHITSPLVKSFLAHEFVHLITFNQKENTYDLTEKTWLNEARAEYAPTLIGYDDLYEGSNLERRVQTFINEPSDSIIDWQGAKEDYGTVHLFIQYLVDHYGLEILIDSLQSSKTGIESINYALKKNGFEKNFSQIFLDWTIAVLINDCNYGDKYCYLNPNLRNFRVSPKINFLPLSGESTLTLTDLTKNYAGNWYKIIGGKGTLKFNFTSGPGSDFQVPYITKNLAGSYNVKFLKLDDNGKGEVLLEDFGKDITALFLIPSVRDSQIDEAKLYYSFSWSSSIEKPKEDPEIIQKLLTRIAEIKAEIARIQARIEAILAGRGQVSPQPDSRFSCDRFKNNLYFGLMNNQEVHCLQQFLKDQGPDIYPEGLVTGNFLSLTKAAVVRFQEKYAEDILFPWNLEQGSGYVGVRTRAKINEILNK